MLLNIFWYGIQCAITTTFLITFLKYMFGQLKAASITNIPAKRGTKVIVSIISKLNIPAYFLHATLKGWAGGEWTIQNHPAREAQNKLSPAF